MYRIKINIEVADQDAQEPMTWYAAIDWCKSLGDGWRLPPIGELAAIYHDIAG